MLAVRQDFLALFQLDKAARLDDEQCSMVTQALRKRYLEDEAVFTKYTTNVREYGADGAQRRLRSSFRTSLRMRFGHPVVVSALVKLGFWSPMFAENLANEQQRRAADTSYVANPRGTGLTTTGRRKSRGPQKASKRKRYYVRLGTRIAPEKEASLTPWSRWNIQRGRNGELAQAALTCARLQGPPRCPKPLLPAVLGPELASKERSEEERQQGWQEGWQEGWQRGWQEWKQEPWQGASSELAGGPSGRGWQDWPQDH